MYDTPSVFQCFIVEMSGKQKKQPQPTPQRDLPPPPPALLHDEDPEERNRTLVNPGSATHGSRGEGRGGGGHRAEFSPVNVGTVKTGSHKLYHLNAVLIICQCTILYINGAI